LFDLERGVPAWGVTYRPIFGVPLEGRYLAAGWTSHLLLTEPDGTQQKIDFFGKPPRVPQVETEADDPDYATRHVVALMKRTDRDRDWQVVFGCGVQMLERQDWRGILHLQEPDWIVNAWTIIPPETRTEFQRLRPLLKSVEPRPEQLRRLLLIERSLWEAVNRTRYHPFERVWKEFYRRWKASPGWQWPFDAPFSSQHHTLSTACHLFNLPANPLADKSRSELLREAQADVVERTAATGDELDAVTPPLDVLYP